MCKKLTYNQFLKKYINLKVIGFMGFNSHGNIVYNNIKINTLPETAKKIVTHKINGEKK